VHPCRGGFIRPIQDASVTHEAIGRGCHQRDGFTWPGFGREIPPLQRCVDHPRPLMMNAGVTTPDPPALGFRLCAFGLRLPLSIAATHGAIGRGCHQGDGFTGPGFWAGNPAPTTLRRSPVLADDRRRRHDARSACLGLSALCFRPSASVFNCRDSRSDRPRVSPAGRVHRGRVLGGKSRPIQRCVDHPPPLVMNAGVARPVPRALGFALCFRLSAA
jgi:hypothetical protein